MKFRECEVCGAALDPGEKCDCSTENNLPAIRCTQLPVIAENLDSVRQNLESLLADISTLPFNDEALKYVKQIRANLSRDFEQMENQRKAVKRQVMEPYDQAEKKYKEYIAEPYRAADQTLKAWVDNYQNGLKKKCEDYLREYFLEVCQSYHIDFLKFEDCGVVVDMALARQKEPRKAMDKICDFVAAINGDIDSILSMADAGAVLAEYKKCLSLGVAMNRVFERKKETQQAQEKISAMKQTAAIEAEVIKKVESVAPPALAKKESVICCTFKAIGTRTQIKKMKEFAIKEGIRFE